MTDQLAVADLTDAVTGFFGKPDCPIAAYREPTEPYTRRVQGDARHLARNRDAGDRVGCVVGKPRAAVRRHGKANRLNRLDAGRQEFDASVAQPADHVA